MQRAARAIRPFLGSKAFYAGALSVTIPVAVQQLINNLFNMVDNVMVGRLDELGLAMSAVSVANKPYLIFFGVFFGLAGAGGLMLSQYYGAGDRKTCQGLFSLQMVLGIGFSLLFFGVLFCFPAQVMRIYVKDERTIALGVKYIRIVCFSYLPVAISNTCIFSLRSLGQNKTSMVVSLAAMGVNAACNYILIFGKLGFPALGVEGAAWGTLIARVFEMGFYLVLIFRRRMYFTPDFGAFRTLEKRVVKTYASKAIPLMVNELLWTVGMNVFFWSYARLDEASLPAITIAEQCYMVSAVLAMGNSSAVSVLVGTELGAGRLEKAKENCKKLFSMVLAVGLVCTSLCVLLGLAMPYAFSVSAELRARATQLAMINALFAVANFVYAFCFFCLRAGGDTRNAMMLDSVYMWIIPVPASILLGLFLPGKISIVAAMVIIQLLMNAKVVLALRVLKKGSWLRNITVAET